MRIDYEPGDYAAQIEAWRMATVDIIEVRKNQWWRKLWRRLTS